MNTKTKSNLIASIVLGLAPIGPLALLLPSGEMVASVLVVAGLAGLGLLEMKGATASLARRAPKGAAQLFRQAKAGL